MQISQLTLQVQRMDQVAHTADAIADILGRRHEQVDYSIVTPLELLEQARTMRLMFMAFWD